MYVNVQPYFKYLAVNPLLCAENDFFSLQVLKRDNDLYELTKKAEQESSGEPVNTEESEVIEANKTPDILIQPLRYAHTNTL